MIDKGTLIDAVITWVDGNDIHHLNKRMKILEDEIGLPRNDLITSRDETRFLDNGELYYCIKSIRTFIPWIRTIYLVTDNQVPGFLTPDMQKHYQIQLVDHREIFPRTNGRFRHSIIELLKQLFGESPGLQHISSTSMTILS